MEHLTLKQRYTIQVLQEEQLLQQAIIWCWATNAKFPLYRRFDRGYSTLIAAGALLSADEYWQSNRVYDRGTC